MLYLSFPTSYQSVACLTLAEDNCSQLWRSSSLISFSCFSVLRKMLSLHHTILVAFSKLSPSCFPDITLLLYRHTSLLSGKYEHIRYVNRYVGARFAHTASQRFMVLTLVHYLSMYLGVNSLELSCTLLLLIRAKFYLQTSLLLSHSKLLLRLPVGYSPSVSKIHQDTRKVGTEGETPTPDF